MSLRITFANEAVAIAAMSTVLAIIVAWHFERSGPDYEILRQLESVQEPGRMHKSVFGGRRAVGTEEPALPLHADNGCVQR